MTRGHDLTAGVAVRVSALCLDRRGRPSPLLICSAAVRAGLLLDLALAARITQTASAIDVDATPTGFAPADELLEGVLAEPDRPLDGWLDDRRLTLGDVVAANEASGRWRRRRRVLRRDTYVDDAEDVTWADRSHSPELPPAGSDPVEACVTVVLAASGLLDRRHGFPVEVPAGLLDAAGDARWLAEHVAGHLTATQRRYRMQARAMGTSDTFGPG